MNKIFKDRSKTIENSEIEKFLPKTNRQQLTNDEYENER